MSSYKREVDNDEEKSFITSTTEFQTPKSWDIAKRKIFIEFVKKSEAAQSTSKTNSYKLDYLLIHRPRRIGVQEQQFRFCSDGHNFSQVLFIIINFGLVC